jgi:hypothetical protein
VVPVRDEESAAVRLESELDSHGNGEGEPRRRVVARKRADVRDESGDRGAVHAVDPHCLRVTGEQVRRKVRSDDADERVCLRADEGNVHDAAERELAEPLRQTAGVQRLIAARAIDTPDLAARRLSHIHGAARADCAASGGSARQRGEQLGRGRSVRDERHHQRDERRHHGE